MGVPIIHVIVTYRDSGELLSNPFWKSIHDDPTKKRSGVSKHNIKGSPGCEIISELYDPARDLVVDTKKRYSPFLHTELEFVLRSRGIDTIVLCGINTTSCVLCAGFEATNLDFRVVVADEPATRWTAGKPTILPSILWATSSAGAARTTRLFPRLP